MHQTEWLDETLEGLAPGEYLTDNKTFLKVQTGAGVLLIKDLQMQGKRRMVIEDFLRGNSL